MALKKVYHEVLGVSRRADGKTIPESYRKLAIKYHPDKNPGNEEATLRFKESAEVFEFLHDPEKRARYDLYGHAGVNGGATHFNDINDIFSAFGDIFGGGAFDFFGGGRSGRGARRVRRGADIGCTVS